MTPNMISLESEEFEVVVDVGAMSARLFHVQVWLRKYCVGLFGL